VSTSNIALFEGAYQAYVERSDLDVFYRTLDPDVEWRAWNDEGNCHGRDEVMALIRSAFEGGVAVEVPPHVDAGDKLVLMPREMPPFFPPDAEGLFQGVEIRDGTIVAIRDFIHRDDAMAASGP
jgi:limonene-1,2-epoxide hydrolase